MRLRRRHALSVARKFVRVPRDGNPIGHQLLQHGLSRMYYEDCHQRLIPYVFNEDAKFKVNVIPVASSSLVGQLFSKRGSDDESLEACFREFLSEATQLLILDQAAIFEICEVSDDDESERAQKRLTLISVLADSVEFQGDKVIQEVKQSSFQDAQTIAIPKESVFLVEPPNWIEDGVGFRFVISNLIEETKRGFVPTNLFESARKKENFFDYSEFRRMQEIRILRLTRASGWQGRTQYSARITEYYFVERYLRFVHNNLLMRDYLIGEINKRLFPALRKQGLDVESIGLSGLPTAQDILSILDELNDGKIGFKEALKRAREWD